MKKRTQFRVAYPFSSAFIGGQEIFCPGFPGVSPNPVDAKTKIISRYYSAT